MQNPNPWPVLVAVMLGAFGAQATLICCAQRPAETAQDVTEVGSFNLEQQACVNLDASLADRVACVRKVRDRWCALWRTRLDAEVCP